MAVVHRDQGVPIKTALLERRTTQRETARRLKMKLATFNMKLRGERSFTDAEKEKLATILDVPLERLFPNYENNQGEQNTQSESAANA